MPLRSHARLLFVALLISLPVAAAIAQPADSALPDMRWRLIGPFRGGRTRAAAGVPSQPNVFYVGQVNGGVWKSDDYGRTWNPIFDDQPSQSIGAIAVAPSDPNIVYVASGEGLHRPDLSVGDGIYRSADAGKSWTHLGLRDGQQIPDLAVDPRDPNRLFAAVLGHPYGPNNERGIYRSTDGGATWVRVLSVDSNTGGSQVVLDPRHPDTVYASMWESRLGPWEDRNQYDGNHGGLFKSTDGGATWTKLTTGLPEDLQQIQLAIAPSDSNRLYATLATAKQGGYASGDGLGLYRSDDAGATWRKATDDPRPAMKIGGGDLPIPAVDPKDPDTVYVASIVTVRSSDGGHTWLSLRGAPGGDDYQNLWINPANPDIILLVADQGALVTVNRGQTWSSWYNQPTAQLYHVAVTNTFPYQVCAGQQESGSVCISSRGNDGEITERDWHPVGIIEYGYAAPDPLHPEYVYGAGRTEVSRFNMITGQTQNLTPVPLRDPGIHGDRSEPILFSPVDPHRLYYAANILFESTDYGNSWQKISPDLSREHAGQLENLPKLSDKEAAARYGAIYSLAASYQNIDTLWAGTDDGLVWTTRDHGKHWKDITPPGLKPWSKISQLSASHFDDQSAYISVSRFRLDDQHAYLYRTHDGGATWQSIAAGLPDSPVNTVREDPIRKGLLFAGTETAVWFSLDDGDHWQALQINLPHTSMRDLWVKDNDLIVATHGRSFWILDDISPLRQLEKVKAEPVLFTPGNAWRVRRSTYTDTPIPADEPTGQNPPDGAVLDYWLPADAKGPVTLEILDAAGKVVRRYASTDAPELTQDQLAKQLIPLVWVKMPQTLPATAGFHRWVWDLHSTTPVATYYDYPISAVPHATPRLPLGTLALPGTYQARLTVGGKVVTERFTVKIDPRVPATPKDLETLFALENKLSGMVDSSARAALAAHSLREQLAKLARSAPADLKLKLDAADKQLATLLNGERKADGAESEPGLDDVAGSASGLYGQVGQADAIPTASQQQAASRAEKEQNEALELWEKWNKSELPALNSAIKAAGLPGLDAKLAPSSMPEQGDED